MRRVSLSLSFSLSPQSLVRLPSRWSSSSCPQVSPAPSPVHIPTHSPLPGHPSLSRGTSPDRSDSEGVGCDRARDGTGGSSETSSSPFWGTPSFTPRSLPGATLVSPLDIHGHRESYLCRVPTGTLDLPWGSTRTQDPTLFPGRSRSVVFFQCRLVLLVPWGPEDVVSDPRTWTGRIMSRGYGARGTWNSGPGYPVPTE